MVSFHGVGFMSWCQGGMISQQKSALSETALPEQMNTFIPRPARRALPGAALSSEFLLGM